MNLQDRVVIVTGSGGPGCGRAIALRFAALGATVVVTDIDEQGGQETRELIESAGGKAVFLRFNLDSEYHASSLIRTAEERFGGIDVIVNNASAAYRASEPFEHWVETLEVDLLAPIYLTIHGLPILKRRGGAIVNIASVSAVGHGRKHAVVPAYDVAKAGLIRLTTTLGILQSEGVRVNCLAPGWIATPEVQAYVDTLDPAQRSARGVPDTLLDTSQIADAVVRLATDESLAGRVMVWWNDQAPGLIPAGSQGYERLEPLPPQ
jgi:NAD(P)-dependent dehydrogenase (short-subunit alcohol dehydrogenase family)